MAKKVKCTTGDVFAIPVSETEFIFGRVLFDVTKQYIKIVPEEERELNDLGFFNKSVLVEMFLGVYTSVEDVDFEKKAVTGTFVFRDFLSKYEGVIVGKREVNPIEVSFPEVLSRYNMNVYLASGELYLPIPIDGNKYNKIGVYASSGYGYYNLIVATLDFSGRDDLIKEDAKMDNYFEHIDLRSRPELRSEIYASIHEDTNQNYYDMALKYGFDLKRLYEQITGKEKARAKKEKYPQEIMTDVRWAFYGGQYDTIEEFMKAVQEYHEELDADGWQPKEVVLACKEVTVQYAYWDEDEEDETEEDFRLTADGDGFTAGELLFKIHNRVVGHLENEDHHFFEGLSLYEDAAPENSPFYFLELGS